MSDLKDAELSDRNKMIDMTVDVYRCDECGETVPTAAMAWDHVMRNGHAPIMSPYREAVLDAQACPDCVSTGYACSPEHQADEPEEGGTL